MTAALVSIWRQWFAVICGKVPCSEIKKRTNKIDIIEYTPKRKWRWAGHARIARMKDNRWAKRCTGCDSEREEI